MEVSYKYHDGFLEMHFGLAEGEGVSKKMAKGNYVRMNDPHCRFRMPDGWNLESIHPDLLALAVIYLIYPYTNKEIKLSLGISQDFADLCKQIIHKTVGPVDPKISARKAGKDAKVALAYSGGMDSTAALAILPKDTYLFLVDREKTERISRMYNKTSMYYAYDALQKAGRVTYKMLTDFESRLRNPIGFPTDMVCMVPCILLADFYPTNTIAAGMILESSYKIGHEQYVDYPNSWHYRTWGKLAEGVDLPFSLVTAGLSEVATSLVVKRAGYEDIAQSCGEAELHKPCMRCAKCVRKVMLDDALTYGEVREETVSHFMKTPTGRKIITGDHIHHQDVMMYTTSHYHGQNKGMQLFKKRIGADKINVDWLEKWYAPSIEVVAEPYRQYVKEQIQKYVGTMNEKEQALVESWNIESFMSREEYQRITEELIEDLEMDRKLVLGN